MNFSLTEEQKMIQETVRKFVENEIAPVANEIDEKGEYPFDLVKKMGVNNLFGIPFPAKYGGSEAGYLSYVITAEEVAREKGAEIILIDGSPGIGCPVIASLTGADL